MNRSHYHYQVAAMGSFQLSLHPFHQNHHDQPHDPLDLCLATFLNIVDILHRTSFPNDQFQSCCDDRLDAAG